VILVAEDRYGIKSQDESVDQVWEKVREELGLEHKTLDRLIPARPNDEEEGKIRLPLPDRQTIKRALLNRLIDGQVHHSDEIEDWLISRFRPNLSEVIGTGRTKFGNEIDWAKVELGKQGLLVKTANKRYQITEKGLAELGRDSHHVPEGHHP
jgi:hypothetical protein